MPWWCYSDARVVFQLTICMRCECGVAMSKWCSVMPWWCYSDARVVLRDNMDEARVWCNVRAGKHCSVMI
jgi:hypothetical protein